MKNIVAGIAPISLGSSFLGITSVEAANISSSAPVNTITDMPTLVIDNLQDMSKYSTVDHDEQTRNLIVHVSSKQLLLYLKDQGVQDKYIPTSLKSKDVFEVFKLTFDKESIDRSINICLSGEGNHLYKNKVLNKYFESLISGLYFMHYLQG